MGLRHFFGALVDKSRGKGIEVEQFSNLFAMQVHTGICGGLFSGLWFLLATLFVPDLWTKGGLQLALIATAIVIAFFVIAEFAFLASRYIDERLAELHDPKNEQTYSLRSMLDVRLRIWMAWFCVAYAFVCSVLVWLTGGVISPFVPLYVMVFTLTITKTKVSPPGMGLYICGYFLIVIVGASFLAEVLRNPIDGSIRESPFQIGMHILFVSAALVVPTGSQYRVERRDEKHPSGRSQQEPAGEAATRSLPQAPKSSSTLQDS